VLVHAPRDGATSAVRSALKANAHASTVARLRELTRTEGTERLPTWYPWLLLTWVALFVVGAVVILLLILLAA
jgi:hypothetical protein